MLKEPRDVLSYDCQKKANEHRSNILMEGNKCGGNRLHRGKTLFRFLKADPILFPTIRRCEGPAIKIRLGSSLPINRIELLIMPQTDYGDKARKCRYLLYPERR